MNGIVALNSDGVKIYYFIEINELVKIEKV